MKDGLYAVWLRAGDADGAQGKYRIFALRRRGQFCHLNGRVLRERVIGRPRLLVATATDVRRMAQYLRSGGNL